jgi:hypothetical protein
MTDCLIAGERKQSWGRGAGRWGAIPGPRGQGDGSNRRRDGGGANSECRTGSKALAFRPLSGDNSLIRDSKTVGSRHD